MVTRLEALELLVSDSALERLRAARALRHLALPSDREAISTALTFESDAWARSALSRIASPKQQEPWGIDPADDVVEDVTQIAYDVRAQTTEALTAMVTHELEPLLGSLRTSCLREVSDFERSNTRRAIAGIESFLDALHGLHRASGMPSVSDFSLSDTVLEAISTVQNERHSRGATEIPVDTARSEYVAALGDRNLVRLALVNVLRNALEASDPTEGGDGQAVVVSWGTTDRDAWVAVFDRGIGLPLGASRMLEPGVTTKDKGANSGMGLAVSVMALQSMNGTLNHRPRDGGGVVAEMRWTGDEKSNARASSRG